MSSITQSRGVPFVLLDREVPGVECDVVLGDSVEGARQLTEHLIARGHRRIALVNGSSVISSARLRREGYTEGLRLAGLPFEPGMVHEASFGPQADLSEMERWLDELSPLPSAFVAGNNVLAMEVMRLLRGRGLRVPDDCSVVCFDDFGPVAELEPFMTVAAQQAYQFGYMGIQLLIERIKGEGHEQHEGDSNSEDKEAPQWKRIVLPAELIVRRSVRELEG